MLRRFARGDAAIAYQRRQRQNDGPGMRWSTSLRGRSLINIPPLEVAARHRSVWTALVRPSPTLPAVADRPEAAFHGLILVHQPGNFRE